MAITFFIGSGNLLDFIGRSGAKDFDQKILIGAQTFDGFVALFSTILDSGHHQGDDDIFKIAAKFFL
jgi:hypothetical protein